MVFFTSDTHFFHEKVIGYCKRPFAGAADMNDTMIRNWNSRVNETDTVYHLGDFAMGPVEKYAEVLSELKGKKILIRGNHDRSVSRMISIGFHEVHNELILPVSALADGFFDCFSARPTQVYMHHQPMPKEMWRGADYHFCGHVHEAWARKKNMINVGVDVSGFTPLTFSELLLRDSAPHLPEDNTVV